MNGLEILSLGYGVEIDDAGLRLVECAGYFDRRAMSRVKPPGFYIEQKDAEGNWTPIRGPYFGGPLGGYPPKAEDELRLLCK